MKGGVKMKSKKLSYNKILVLFSIVVVLVLMTGCNGGAPPIVNIFSANPPTINQGESSTLTWSVSDADTVTITPGVGTVTLSGSTSVSPAVTTDYILTATNSAGSVTASATVNVQLPPVHNLTKNTYYNTIQAALDDADSNNTIEVADGTYDETIDFPSGKRVILQSVNGPFSTTIRGDDNSSTVNLSNSLPGTTIEGFTITHAVGLSGGGIFNDVGNLTIYNCTVSGNTANWGGGIYIDSLSTTITASTISGNSAGQGGGIYINVVSFIPTIGGSSSAKKNTIYGNYKSGNSPSLDQQVRDSSGSAYGTYKNTNYIYTNCPF